MSTYQPLYISGNTTGLVKERQEFILPNDAYPILENAYVWREQIRRKQGYKFLGRLQRNFTDVSLGDFVGSDVEFNIFSSVTPAITEINASLVLSSTTITFDTKTFIDQGQGVLVHIIAAYNGAITNITPESDFSKSIIIESINHGLTIGDQVVISNVVGIESIINGSSFVNGNTFFVRIIDLDNFSVRINMVSASYTPYVSGGIWTSTDDPSEFGTIDYNTGDVTITTETVGTPAATITFSYYPNLPVMGIRQRDQQNAVGEETIIFDTVYAYNFNSSINSFEEFLPGTTWTGTDSNFFWTTNYFIGDGNKKIFWETNFSSTDPIRYCNGTTSTSWIDFSPIINSASDTLNNCRCLIPFRGRLVAFNTVETTGPYSNRIRWAAIGNPFTVVSDIVSDVSVDAWRDDIRGKGGFLDIPTNEDIISVGFVRDNLVVFCERSTWQLRYTGRTIAPFQIEKVNSEIGSTSTFSAIQFDTSLLGIGDKGIIECDSFKSEKIDIKIPDFVFHLNSKNQGPERIQGIRDFINKLAYWTYVSESNPNTYPDKRLVYNYENDSWATFTDSLTALGTFQVPSSRTWKNTKLPWIKCNFPWISQPYQVPAIVGGNQQGFIEYLDEQNTNDASLFISAIMSNGMSPTVITSPMHNLKTGQIIQITDIPVSSSYANLNDMIFSVDLVGVSSSQNNFILNKYDPNTEAFTISQIDPSGTYPGGGLISVRDNFSVVSKKFNFLDQGESIQLGFIDILMDATEQDNPGAISLKVYLDYNENQATNIYPQNTFKDTFFNSVIPTCSSSLNNIGGNKFWQRVYCPTRGNFITLEYTFNNSQMNGVEQEESVQIDAQILHIRKAGRLTQI